MAMLSLPAALREEANLKISVITAVREAESTIGQAIRSVADQSWQDLEHVVIEGRSSDGTLAAIKATRHDRMTLISEADRGIYDALNKGIRLATGDVVGFLHGDDFLAHPQVLARVAASFDTPRIEAVFSDLDYVDKLDGERVVRRWRTGPFSPSRLRHGWMPAHPTLYLRREVYQRIGGYDADMRISADYDFILRYFSQVQDQTVHIPEVLYKMRMGGVSNRNLVMIALKMREDLQALKRNNVGGLSILAMKNLSKIGQFLKHANS